MQEHVRRFELSEKPRRLLVGGMQARQMLIAKPLLKWYLEHLNYLYLYCGDSLATHTDIHAGDFVVDLPKTYYVRNPSSVPMIVDFYRTYLRK